MPILFWIGIMLCISQSAMLSGLNFVFFTVSKPEFEMWAIEMHAMSWL